MFAASTVFKKAYVTLWITQEMDFFFFSVMNGLLLSVWKWCPWREMIFLRGHKGPDKPRAFLFIHIFQFFSGHLPLVYL